MDERDDLFFAFSSWLSGLSRFFAYSSAQMMHLALAFSYLQERSTFGREPYLGFDKRRKYVLSMIE